MSEAEDVRRALAVLREEDYPVVHELASLLRDGLATAGEAREQWPEMSRETERRLKTARLLRVENGERGRRHAGLVAVISTHIEPLAAEVSDRLNAGDPPKNYNAERAAWWNAGKYRSAFIFYGPGIAAIIATAVAVAAFFKP